MTLTITPEVAATLNVTTPEDMIQAVKALIAEKEAAHKADEAARAEAHATSMRVLQKGLDAMERAYSNGHQAAPQGASLLPASTEERIKYVLAASDAPMRPRDIMRKLSKLTRHQVPYQTVYNALHRRAKHKGFWEKTPEASWTLLPQNGSSSASA